MAITGEIARKAREYMPATWDALLNDARYGEALLQARVDIAKLKLFGTELTAEQESIINPLVADYIGKIVILEIVPAGADYWANQATNISATGRNETKEYLDRVEKLWMLRDRIFAETRAEWQEISVILGVSMRKPRRSPSIRVGRPDPNTHLTVDPDTFGAPYVVPVVVP